MANYRDFHHRSLAEGDAFWAEEAGLIHWERPFEKVLDYSRLSFEVSSHAYGTMYYAMTGLHWLHVAAGLVLMFVVLGRISHGTYRVQHIDGLHAVGYYWHFVDIVWIGLFATLFLVR